MTRVLVDDPDLARHLKAARTRVEVCDASGFVLGEFVPHVLEEGSAPADGSLGPPRRSGDAGDDVFWKSVGID